MQYCFYRYALLADLKSILLKEHLSRTQQNLKRVCLKQHFERSLKLCDWSSTQVSLFLLTGEAGIMNVEGCGTYFFLFMILRRYRFLIYKFTNSTMNINSYTN